MLPRFSDENFPKNLRTVDQFRAVAGKYGATPSQLELALAWILAAHPDFVPIPGTRTVERLEENARAAEIMLLGEEDVRALRAIVDAADVQGERTASQFARFAVSDCIPLSQWKGELS